MMMITKLNKLNVSIIKDPMHPFYNIPSNLAVANNFTYPTNKIYAEV